MVRATWLCLSDHLYVNGRCPSVTGGLFLHGLSRTPAGGALNRRSVAFVALRCVDQQLQNGGAVAERVLAWEEKQNYQPQFLLLKISLRCQRFTKTNLVALFSSGW